VVISICGITKHSDSSIIVNAFTYSGRVKFVTICTHFYLAIYYDVG